ncbi:MAG: hypothetical protein GDA43_00510 [Hormoscilla sp. SP5CHS1]|nr:hypothetical protein [Hormoscilla sp. SP12CHS1]MBC6451851.1 hypothetical protein [Hormoscilla sp. SP5CHS1]
MNVKMRINEIIIGKGVDVPRSMRRILQAALEAELARILTEKGLSPKLEKGARIPSLPVNLELKGKTSPDRVGKMLARSIYAELAK